MYPRVVHPKIIHRTLKKMGQKGLVLEEIDKKAKEPVYCLTNRGMVTRSYLFPITSFSRKGVKMATILVTPEQAARETGLPITSVKRKHRRQLHYLTVDRTMYILKSVEISNLLHDIPAFPVVTSLLEMIKIFPNPPHSIYPVLAHLQSDDGTWFWTEVLETLLIRGNKTFPEYKKTKEVNNAITLQRKCPEAAVGTEVSSS